MEKLEIIELLTAPNQEYWLEQLSQCDWEGGKFLHHLLRQNKLKETLGQTALVPLLVQGKNLVAFCTFAPLDDIQPTELTPWIGFVYTFPAYRGHRYAGLLLEYGESIARIMGKQAVYISTGHTGLYEKYGYQFDHIAKDVNGEDSRIYRKVLSDDQAQKGAAWKAEIVRRARMGVDMTAFCGFSCNHCFYGQWCGGCRSVFNCCSFGTLHEKGQCPNAACCQRKNIDGCYACAELDTCTNGFYQPHNGGAAACKAQAMFIRKYGKAAFAQVCDRLHAIYDFEKTQELLGPTAQEGLRFLEGWMDDDSESR